jgi:hypothetical protein
MCQLHIQVLDAIKKKKIMKKIITLLVICFLASVSFGQTEISIEYISGDSVTVNGISISNLTNYDEIVKIIGKQPVIYKEYPTGKTNYHYKELGLVLHTLNGKLLTIGVNYNWDGDKNFPEKEFKGNLTIGKTRANQNTKPEIIEEMKDLEIQCIIPGMCMNNPKTVKNPILIGFKDGLITQVSIEFH